MFLLRTSDSGRDVPFRSFWTHRFLDSSLGLSGEMVERLGSDLSVAALYD